jgi:hypothetical protein
MKNRHRALRIFVTFVIFLIAGNAGAQTISINSISSSSFCVGNPISVTFTTTGSWGVGNVFLLQLSGPNGSFSSGFQYIGSIGGTLPGTFTIDTTIWASAGLDYRLRILSTNPSITSADNGSPIAIWTGPGDFSLYSDALAGAVGTPVAFAATSGDLDPVGNFQDTAFMDFGSDATPANASISGINTGGGGGFTQQATYSTTGDKTITLTIGNPGGCSETLTCQVHIYDCSTPSIPADAIVVNSDTTVVEGKKTYWVNPGFTLNLPNADLWDTIFAEPGSTISAYAGWDCIIYLKQGSVFNSSKGWPDCLIYGNGASINTNVSSDFTLNCPNLDFDYSNAPPNPAHPTSGVKNDLTTVPITVSPNPTGGMLSVQGLPLDNITVSVFNTLGETVMEQKNPPASDFTLDLSKLDPGSYYIRISSANSVVTKKVVRE